jgi:hypothetical protein
MVHGVTCRDYCLSPQCRDATSTIAHRHEFAQDSCGTKTSRVRPADSEAIFKFIHKLVHPALEVPAEVFTSLRSGHLDSKSRKSRRKPNREDLMERLDTLEGNLEDGEKQNSAATARIKQLESDLASAIAKTDELEKQNRRIVDILSDALRTGSFSDRGEYLSLRKRVMKDAADALSFESDSVITPAPSNGSQRSDIPTRNDYSMPGLCQDRRGFCSQPSLPESSKYSSRSSYGSLHLDASQGHVANRNQGHHDINANGNDKLDLQTSTARPTYAPRHTDSTRFTSVQGSDVGAGDGVSMHSHQADINHQRIELDAASDQGKSYASGADFSNFGSQSFDLDSFDAGGYSQDYIPTFPNDLMRGAPNFSMTHREQMQGG